MERQFERYTKRILDILRLCDINTLSALQVRLQIQAEYKIDLSSVKKPFEKHVSALFQQIYANIISPVDEIPEQYNSSNDIGNTKLNSSNTGGHVPNSSAQHYVTTGSLQPRNATGQYISDPQPKSYRTNEYQPNIPDTRHCDYTDQYSGTRISQNDLQTQYGNVSLITNRINQSMHDSSSSNVMVSTFNPNESFPSCIKSFGSRNDRTKSANDGRESDLQNFMEHRTEKISNNQNHTPTKSPAKNIPKSNLNNQSKSPTKHTPPHLSKTNKYDRVPEHNRVRVKEMDRSQVGVELIAIRKSQNLTPVLAKKKVVGRVGSSLSRGLKNESKATEIIDLDSSDHNHKNLDRSSYKGTVGLRFQKRVESSVDAQNPERSVKQSPPTKSLSKTAELSFKKKVLKRKIYEEDELEESDVEVAEGYIFPKGTPLKAKQVNLKLWYYKTNLAILALNYKFWLVIQFYRTKRSSPKYGNTSKNTTYKTQKINA
jgi:hypothetical protein